MIAVRLDERTEKRLSELAERTGRTKSYYVREALTQHLEDLEDYYLGMRALEEPGRIYSAREAKSELGI